MDKATAAHRPPRRQNVALILVVLVLVGALLRIGGMFDDLWLDEIWGWGIAQDLNGPVEIFSDENRVHPNQPLNTFLIYMMGDQLWWPAYRVWPMMFGIGVLILLAVWMRRRSAVERVVVMALAAVSYPMVFYSSELRGYSAALFFMFLAIIALDRAHKTPMWAAVFGVSVILGSLSHLLFIPLYGALGLWSLVKFARESPPGQALARLAMYHAVPAGFQLWYFFAFVRGQVGSSDESTLAGALIATTSLVWGGPAAGAVAAAAGVVLLLAGVAGIEWLRREKNDWWVLFGLVVFVSPVAIVIRAALTDELTLLSPRHLLASVVMLLLLVGLMIGRGLARPGALRWLAAGALVVIIGGNLVEVSRFLQHGRGQYLQALQHMVERTPGPVVSVSADHPLRAGMVLRFYARHAMADKRLQFIAGRDEQLPPPQWMILHAPEREDEPNPDPLDYGGDYYYRRVAVFPHYGLSGFTWELYRLAPREQSGAPVSSR